MFRGLTTYFTKNVAFNSIYVVLPTCSLFYVFLIAPCHCQYCLIFCGGWVLFQNTKQFVHKLIHIQRWQQYICFEPRQFSSFFFRFFLYSTQLRLALQTFFINACVFFPFFYFSMTHTTHVYLKRMAKATREYSQIGKERQKRGRMMHLNV